jgi:kinetochore protein NDC80
MIMSLEVALTNRVAGAEEVIDTYNGLLASPGLIPPQDTDLTIELNMATSDLQQMVKGPDTRKVVKPTLNKWAEIYRMDTDSVKHERIAVEDDHDHVMNSCDDLTQEIDAEESKVQALIEQADELRDVSYFMNLDQGPFVLTCYCSIGRSAGSRGELCESSGIRTNDSTS